MSCPFETLGVSRCSTEGKVLHAWRQLMLAHHPDKNDPADEELVRELNRAKDECIKSIIAANHKEDEQVWITVLVLVGLWFASEMASVTGHTIYYLWCMIRNSLYSFTGS